ncbi:dienelactone hydrolase family protein [Pseudonocardia sp. EC080610-09]|uniref:dienelactone hydrolase family protein n=1 Tax=unclassified Pseudonocardia TaxID=2619320 RepID=UPI0006CB1375|nr:MULTISPECIES: dienelactone hydrolase family protein [unclassified Pseudonocardia]ALE72097.1 dienelactone hydrolase family protein [Pseudonocardia sp. EC080625-04]ALL75380.1 dienelactone hydrolase family protein [Pseudonocardia sp. EC080610-09]ALL82406.1 dienelactone hydrolase family protein [Pseudonocardia sp. EC080619-01]
MPRTDLTIPTPDGDARASLHTPDGDGPWPGVVLYVDAGGVRKAMHDMAAHLAVLGYAVLLPDVYHRHGDWAPFDMSTVFTDDDERARLMGMVSSLEPRMVAVDAEAWVTALLDRPEVAGPRVGVTGYCMGGVMALRTAGTQPERVAAAASFHGGNLATDDPASVHRLADRIRATVYVAGATDDRSFPEEQRQRLEEALSGAGVGHTVETYPAAHGFAVPDTPAHDDAAEQRHWEALHRLFGGAL